MRVVHDPAPNLLGTNHTFLAVHISSSSEGVRVGVGSTGWFSGATNMPTGCNRKLGYSKLLSIKRTRIRAAGTAAQKKQAHHIFLLRGVLRNSAMAHPQVQQLTTISCYI